MPTTQNIQNALQAVQNYVALLQAAMMQASQAGDTAKLQSLNYAYRQAQNLEAELTNLLTINVAAAAAADVAAIQQITQQLTAQANQLNAFVQALGVAGSVLQAVGQIVTMVAAL